MLNKYTLAKFREFRSEGLEATEALNLAQALNRAHENEIEFLWERDTESKLSDFAEPADGATDWFGWWCRAHDPATGESCSLCGIHFAEPEFDFDVGANKPYAKQVEAELAAELRAQLKNFIIPA